MTRAFFSILYDKHIQIRDRLQDLDSFIRHSEGLDHSARAGMEE